MGTELTQLSDTLAAAVEAAAPTVVRVEARRRMPASGISWGEGLVVTADHVVEDEEGAQVGLADGSTRAVTAVLRDEATDVAVLRLDGTGPVTPPAVEAAGLAVGHLLLGLARPGRTVRASLGVVSALGDGWRTPAGGRLDRYVETDLAPRAGFSGGPVVDAAGRLVGMSTSGLMRRANLVVPVSTLRRVTTELLERGRVQRGYLGVSTAPVRLPGPVATQVGQPTALLVLGVQEGSPADRAGVLLGDVVLSLHGERVLGMRELVERLAALGVGDRSRLGVLRGGEPRELEVEVGVRDAA
jgi:S1-C subfamily serine protease